MAGIVIICMVGISLGFLSRKGKVGYLLAGPFAVVLFSAGFKSGVGTVLVDILGKVALSEADQGQYIVTYMHRFDLQKLWFAFIFPALIISFIMGNALVRSRRKGPTVSMLSSNTLEEKDVDTFEGLKAGYISIGFGVIVYYLLGILTGSMDRGVEYSSWINAERGIALGLLTSLLRVRDCFYIMTPFIYKHGSVRIRFFGAFVVVFSIASAIMSGGRGDALYPIVMIMIGFLLCNSLSGKDIVRLASGVAVILVISLPVLEAVRDSNSFKESKLSSPLERLGGIYNSFSEVGARTLYRAPQLGRQIYACSDPFLFLQQNSEYLRYGYKDIGRIALSVLPSRLNGGISTFDGSSIAQRLIGTNKPGWFPCISMPADLFRRGGYSSVLIGGSLFWLIIGFLQLLWSRTVITGRFPIFCFFIFIFPLTYIRLYPLGTLSEASWMLGWDLIKYILFFAALSLLCKQTIRLSRGIERARG